MFKYNNAGKFVNESIDHLLIYNDNPLIFLITNQFDKSKL